MELVTILRELWRLRRAVALVTAVAVIAGYAVAFHLSLPPQSRKYEVGVANARILVDTPSSQVVEVAPKGSDSLGVRANLLANLMVAGVVKGAIASQAGLRPDQLTGVAETDTSPAPSAPPPNPRGNVLTTHVLSSADGERLPIIEIEAQAPDADGAMRLANAAVSGLHDYIDSRAADEQVVATQRLRVTGLGPAQAREVTRGPRLAYALAAAIFVFALGCGALLLVARLIQGWYAASLDERLEQSRIEEDLEPLDGVFDTDLPRAGTGHVPARSA